MLDTNIINEIITISKNFSETNAKATAEKLNKLIESNSNNITMEIIYNFTQNCLSQNKDIKSIIFELFDRNKKNRYNIFCITKSFTRAYLSQNKDVKSVIFELCNNNKDNLEPITKSFVEACLSENKPMSNLKEFIIEVSKRKDTEFDLIYDTIRTCCYYKYTVNKVEIDSQNFKDLIGILNNLEKEEIKTDSQKVLCGMFICDYLFRKGGHIKDEKNSIPTVAPIEFIDLLNKILNTNTTKIEDLTLKDIKTLFNDLMNIKFNKTKRTVDSEDKQTGPFFQIFISLAEHSKIEENTTIKELYKKTNQEKINDFQRKLNRLKYIKIQNDTKIKNFKDFVENILKLTKDDFGKEGFDIFELSTPTHSTTLVVDISKPFNEFINQNENTDYFKGIVLFDSSHAISAYKILGNGELNNFMQKIPVQNISYQQNRTCWANSTCVKSVLLNNYTTFEEIVNIETYKKENFKSNNGKPNHTTYTFEPKDKIIQKIINETDKYYVSNINKIENESDYAEIYRKDDITITANIQQKQFFQHATKQFEFRENKLTEIKNQLKNTQKEQLEKLKKELEEFKKCTQFIKKVGNQVKYNTLTKTNELLNKINILFGQKQQISK